MTFFTWLLFLYGLWRIGDPFPLLSVSHGIFTIEQVNLKILSITVKVRRNPKKTGIFYISSTFSFIKNNI